MLDDQVVRRELAQVEKRENTRWLHQADAPGVAFEKGYIQGMLVVLRWVLDPEMEDPPRKYLEDVGLW